MRNDTDHPDILPQIYHSLSAPRRCHVIQLLSERADELLTVRTLASEIAAIERGVEPYQATGAPYQNVYNALSQTHLPTLEDTGIIIYEPNRQTVAPGPLFDVTALVIDSNKSIYNHLGGDSSLRSVGNEEGSTTD
jgi:DNA-binding transcriptional ArsR family regulator